MYPQHCLSKAYQYPLHVLKTQLPGRIYLANEMCALFYTPAAQAESCQPGTAQSHSSGEAKTSIRRAATQLQTDLGKPAYWFSCLRLLISNERYKALHSLDSRCYAKFKLKP